MNAVGAMNIYPLSPLLHQRQCYVRCQDDKSETLSHLVILVAKVLQGWVGKVMPIHLSMTENANFFLAEIHLIYSACHQVAVFLEE